MATRTSAQIFRSLTPQGQAYVQAVSARQPAAPHTAARTPPATIPASAQSILGNLLGQFGLGSLLGWAFQRYIALGGGQAALDVINLELPQQQAFQRRFPAYAVLQKQGDTMTPAEMISYEKQVRQTLAAAGADASLTSTNYIQGLLAKNISPAEVSQRVSMAVQAANSQHETVAALSRLYGFQAGHLTSFFLDPDVVGPRLTQMWQAGQIAGEASTQGFGDLSRLEAERLASFGVTDAQAAQGFGQLAGESGLLGAQVTGEGTMDRATSLGLVAGLGAAQSAFAQRQASRRAAFGGSAGFGNVAQGGAAGFGQPG